MSVRRNTHDDLIVTDKDGDRLVVERLEAGNPWLVLVSGVGLDLADGLALLSFLADALGVERYVPEPARVKRPPIAERAVAAVRCSSCNAFAGVQCVDIAGKRGTLKAPHPIRVVRYREVADQGGDQ